MDAKTFYEQIAPELDPGGFKLYFTAQRLTGFELYKQFPYEDSRGMFEMMNGHQLMRYLLADQFQAIRWEIVPGTCYERAVLLPIDHTTPAYRAFRGRPRKRRKSSPLLPHLPTWITAGCLPTAKLPSKSSETT